MSDINPQPNPADPDFDRIVPAKSADGTTAPGVRGWLGSRESTFIIAAAVFQLAILAWMIGGTLYMLSASRTILLQVEPVDPRDLFRGDHVILTYSFSQVPPEGVAGLPGPYTSSADSSTWRDQPVYVTLVPNADGIHYRGENPSIFLPPPGTPYIKGTLEVPFRITFGIETFYVQEGEGKRYEEAIRDKKLWAEVALTPTGTGTVRKLWIE